jgi:hypothetical protein
MLITYDQEVWPAHGARESGMVIATLGQVIDRSCYQRIFSGDDRRLRNLC